MTDRAQEAWITEPLKSRLARAHQTHGITRAEIVRRALEAHIDTLDPEGVQHG